MARRRSPWHVDRGTVPLDYAFFISHAGEDADDVRALKAEVAGLSGRGGRPELACYLDLYNWEIGNDPGRVIREAMIRSEYMVAWITPAYLRASSRGWIWYEFAYAELIELGLNAKDSKKGFEFYYIIPVVRGVAVGEVERSPIVKHWLRKPFRPDEASPVSEVARTLVDFYDQEARKRVPPSPGKPTA